MNKIIGWLKRRKAERIAKQKATLRSRLARDLWFIKNETNRGLLRRRLLEMPEVERVTGDYGIYTYVDAYLLDGFEAKGREYRNREPHLDCALEIVQYLKKKYSL